MTKRSNDNWIVCLGGEDWWYHSHAHFDIQVMKHLSKRTSILYVCSIGMRMPSIRNDSMFWKRIKRKLKSVSRTLQEVSPTLFVYSPLPIPLYEQRWGRALNSMFLRAQLRSVYLRLGIKNPLVWVNTPTAWPVVEPLRRRGLVYQRTDDYAAYDFDNFNTEYVKSIDMELVQISDLILHVSDELHSEALKLSTRSMLLPQGVDERFFEQNHPIPSDIAQINKPIIGYIGGMDQHKFDTALVAEVARRLPDFSFVLVGLPNPNTDSLRELNNVHFTGVKTHEEIPAYVHSFDVCILPTAQTEWGLKCRPLKLMEYLAANKPVVATPTPASRGFSQTVYIADDASSWAEAIKLALSEKSSDAEKHLTGNAKLTTWSDLADGIWPHIQDGSFIKKSDESDP